LIEAKNHNQSNDLQSIDYDYPVALLVYINDRIADKMKKEQQKFHISINTSLPGFIGNTQYSVGQEGIHGN